MISAMSTVQFPFETGKHWYQLTVTVQEMYMMGLDIKPCDINVHGSFEEGSQGSATLSGMLQLGQLIFEDTVFVPGLRETIISLGQLDAQGCSTKIVQGKMEVYSLTNHFLLSAFKFRILDGIFFIANSIMVTLSRNRNTQ